MSFWRKTPAHRMVAALFRLEASRDPETVREVLVALAAWLAEPAQAELRYPGH